MRWSLIATVPLVSGLVAQAPALSAALISALVVCAFCLSRYFDHVERVKAIDKAPAEQISVLMSTITGHVGSTTEGTQDQDMHDVPGAPPDAEGPPSKPGP